MSHFRMTIRRTRSLRLERLESRDAPAIVSFRSDGGSVQVSDVTIRNTDPDAVEAVNPSLNVAGTSGSTIQNQVLIRFDNLIGTGSGQIPPNATIAAANLVFWSSGGSVVAPSISIYSLLQPWNPATTTWNSWNNGVQADGYDAVPFADAITTMGTTGYQVTGQNLKQAVQSWANGGANNGWVITADSNSANWSISSSENSVVSQRPCLNVEFTAPGYANPSYVELAGPPPAPTTLAWFDWDNELRNRRVQRVPQERATTFYFSQAGDDVLGQGTIDQPWKSLAKARAVLVESGGQGMRLRFRRGDTWRESTDMTFLTNVSGFSLDDYGDNLLPKPVFSRFLQLNSSNWVHVSGDLYKYVAPAPVGWLRESADGFTRIYYRANSSANVGSRLQSWFYDADGSDANSGGVATLYLNCGQNPSLVFGGFEACPDDGLGWHFIGDNIRLQNVRIEGHGIARHGQSYGLQVLQGGSRHEFVGIGLEVFYTGYHSIGHIVQGSGSKGAMTLIDCKAGLCVNRFGNGNPGSGDITVYVAYGDYGGNEYISYQCEATYGALPSADWAAQPGMGHGSAFYCHVGPGGSLDLVIAERTSTGYCANPLLRRNVLGNLPFTTNLDQARGYIVEDGPGPGFSYYIGAPIAVINCVFDYSDPPPPFDYHYSMSYNSVSRGWLINSTISIDASLQNSFFFLVVYSIYYNAVELINSHVDIYNCTRPVYWDLPFAPAPTVPPPDQSQVRITNSIISFSTTSLTGLAIPNDPDHLNHNAYYLPNLETPAWGFSNDPGAVTLAQRYPVGLRPSASSPLYNGGVLNGLEYDQNRAPRGTLRTIGPLQGVAVPLPVSTHAQWGSLSREIVDNITLWSARVDRIVAEFPANIEIGASALEVFDANGPLPWSAFSFNPAARTGTWTLGSPLLIGNYTLKSSGQILATFSILPGDFNGDGLVSAADFAQLRQVYGSNAFLGDLDGDGTVSANDFNLFRQFYGMSL